MHGEPEQEASVSWRVPMTPGTARSSTLMPSAQKVCRGCFGRSRRTSRATVTSSA
jgi:hypothetical protein